MSSTRTLAIALVILGLAGCVQGAEQGRTPYGNNMEYPRDRAGGSGM